MPFLMHAWRQSVLAMAALLKSRRIDITFGQRLTGSLRA